MADSRLVQDVDSMVLRNETMGWSDWCLAWLANVPGNADLV